MSQASEYKKYREKILKLFANIGTQIPLPPMIKDSWGEMEEDLKKAIAENKEELPDMVAYCRTRLSQIQYFDAQGNYLSYGYYEVLDCIEYVMNKMKTNKVKLGGMLGFLQVELGKEEYWYILPPLLQQIASELSN